MAPQHDAYRKPGRGMWDAFCAHAGVAPNLQSSFFVGDAAGRPSDHGDADKGFATGVGLAFSVPEQVWGVADWAPLREARLAAASVASAAAAAQLPAPAAPALDAPPAVPVAAAATATVIELLDSDSDDAGYDTP
jgi:bifunctional polynucleotide phosphatase/kinase